MLQIGCISLNFMFHKTTWKKSDVSWITVVLNLRMIKTTFRYFWSQLCLGVVSVALMNGFVGCQSACNVTTKEPDTGG